MLFPVTGIPSSFAWEGYDRVQEDHRLADAGLVSP